jgi:hypothetical protein
MIVRIIEDMTEARARLHEKQSELNAYNTTRDEYDNIIENLTIISQSIETKAQQSHGIDLRQRLILLKVKNKNLVFLLFFF